MMDRKKICLDGDWTLFYGPNQEVAAKAERLATREALEQSGLPMIDAKVPGNFELALLDQVLIEDP